MLPQYLLWEQKLVFNTISIVKVNKRRGQLCTRLLFIAVLVCAVYKKGQWLKDNRGCFVNQKHETIFTDSNLFACVGM